MSTSTNSILSGMAKLSLQSNAAASPAIPLTEKIAQVVRASFETYHIESATLKELLQEVMALPVEQQDAIRRLFDQLDEEAKVNFNPLLHRLIDAGDTENALALIVLGSGAIHAAGHQLMTPLHHAAKKGDAAVALALLAAKADVHAVDNIYKWTPLHFAANCGSLEIVTALVEAKAEFNSKAPNIGRKPSASPDCHVTPLAACVDGIPDFPQTLINPEKVQQHLAVISYLLAHDADATNSYSHGAHILNACIQKGANPVIYTLLPHVDLKAVDAFVKSQMPLYAARSPLFVACMVGSLDLVQALHAAGADLHAYGSEGLFSSRVVTPAHVAAVRGDCALMRLLLELGADPNKEALNPMYGKQGVPGVLSQAEPLSAFQMAIDLFRPDNSDSSEMVGTIVAYSQFPIDQTPPPSKRTFWSATTVSKAMKYGRLSLDLRIFTEVMKVKGAVKPMTPKEVRCYTEESNKVDSIRQIIAKTSSKEGLGAASFICWPIMKKMMEQFVVNPKLGIFFLTRDQIQKLNASKESSGLTAGCYNIDTGDIITLGSDFDSVTDGASSLVHETTHKMAHLIYESFMCAPKYDSVFDNAIEQDLKALQQSAFAGCHPLVAHHMHLITEYYKPEQRPSEFMARFAQMAFVLAHDYRLSETQIAEVLKRDLPGLYAFYMQDFLPKLADQE